MEFIKLGAAVLEEIFIKLRDAKTRKILKTIDESLTNYQSYFKYLDESEYRIAIKALKDSRDAKDFLFKTDLDLKVLARETITTSNQCKNIVEVIQKNPEKERVCSEYIHTTMKGLIDKSKNALDIAIKRFEELHEKINTILEEIDVFAAKVEKLIGKLESKKKDAVIDATPSLLGKLLLFDYSKERKIVAEYENAINSTLAAKNHKSNYFFFKFLICSANRAV